MTPRWRRHLDRLVARERPDAVLVFTVPMAHFRGIPTFLRERHGIPVVFYDGDVPMSLPEFGGMDTGFNYYHGADPSEYDLVISNSEGGLGRLVELGARRAEAVLWGADPEFFRPLPVEKEHDVFFYGYGDKFRREWMRELVGEPSRRDPRIDFALGGRDFQGDVGGARTLGDVPFNVFARAISAARVNLNITRRAHATVDGSSTCRPFELASAGAAIVSNPHSGIERWFEPGEELLVVEDADGALEAYQSLLDDPAGRRRDGRAGARARPRRAHVRAPRPSGAPAARARVRGAGMTRIVAVVPAFDEEGAIGSVVEEIRAFDPAIDVVVVDDGSTDGTAANAARRRRGGRPAPVQPRDRRRSADRLSVRARARLRRRRAARRRRPARSLGAAEAARAALAGRGGRRHRLAVPGRRRAATGRRWRAASGSRGSRVSSRCSRASA